MKARSFILASALSTLALAGLPAFAQDAAKPMPGAAAGAAPAAAAAAEKTPQLTDVILTYGNKSITYGDFLAYISVLPQETQAVAKTTAKRQVAEQMVIQKLMADEARAKGLDKSPRYVQQLTIMQDNILVGLLVSSMGESLVTDAEIQKYYDENKTDFDRYTLRTILIPTIGKSGLKPEAALAKANALKKRIDAGEDFAAVAKAESADAGSAENGGLIATPLSRDQIPDEVEALAVSKVSDPIQLKDGYYIFKVEKRETAPFAECKDPIADTLRAQKFDKQTEDMVKKASPKYDDGFFGAPETDQPAAAPTNPEGTPSK